MLNMLARNDYTSGWTEDNHAYLMTEHYGHKKSCDFIYVLTVTQSTFPVAEPTRMVPCCTLFKGNAGLFRVVHMSPDESLHALQLYAPVNKKAHLLQWLPVTYNKKKQKKVI